MAYSTNGGYRSGASYSFSSNSPDYAQNNFSQAGYRNSNPTIRYSTNTGIGPSSPSNFSYEQGGIGTGYATRFGGGSEGGSGRGRGSKGVGRGVGGGMGQGGGMGRGQGRGMQKSGQGCTNMQNQFTADQKNDSPSTEIDLAIKNLNLSDLPQNQIIAQEFTQLEITHYKKIKFVKKQSGEEHLEVIIREVESLNKKSRKNVIR